MVLGAGKLSLLPIIRISLTIFQKKSPVLKATVYTDLLINSKIMNLAPLAPQVWGGTRFQSPPGLASDPAEVPSARERARWDLGGKNLKDETQETYVYTVAKFGGNKISKSPRIGGFRGQKSRRRNTRDLCVHGRF